MAPGPLGVGWAGSFGGELGLRMRRVRSLTCSLVVFLFFCFVLFCYLLGFMRSSDGEVGWRELGGSRPPPPPLFFFFYLVCVLDSSILWDSSQLCY